jgi:hypothetical protein
MTKFVCKGCKDKTCEVLVKEGRGNHAMAPDFVKEQRCVYRTNEEHRDVKWEW